jgi:hypothetical protein
MIPINGAFNVISSVTPATAALNAATITYTVDTSRPLQFIVTAVTTNAAFDAMRTAPFVFLKAASFSDGTRITDTKSPIIYNVTGMSWSANVLTLTHDTLPVSAVASVAGQQIHITNSSNTTKVPNGVYLTVSSASQSVTQTLVTLATDPGSLTGVTAKVQPGIIPSNGDNRGYYTINLPVLANNTAAVASVPWAVNTVPTGATHAILVASTNTNYVAQIVLDGIAGVVFAPANQFICLKNLQAGKFYRANGTAGTDITRVIWCTLNPLGNN